MDRWYKQSVVYQIYPMSFCDSNHDGIGDIQGIISKLDYLKNLGVDIIWLSPIYQSPMDDNGYDISNYHEINPMFGVMDDFKELLEKIHQRDMYLIMDLVVNHTSDEHEWFKNALEHEDSPYRDYYVFRKERNIKKPLHSFFGGSAWEQVKNSDTYYLHMFSKKQPDLNWKNPKLRQEIYKMMNTWLDMGVDGFRMDVIDLIGKDIDQQIIGNGPYLHQYLKEMYQQCFKGRKVLTVGETGGATPEIAILYTSIDSYELDMVFQFQHIGLDQIKGKDKWHLKPLDLVELKAVLSNWQVKLYHQGWNSLYWNNHDQTRIVSRWGNDKEYRVESAKMLGAILHFMQGTPYIYQGEEIGMTNAYFNRIEQLRDIETLNMIKEKELVWDQSRIWEAIDKKGRDNSRTPMQWNEQAYAGFSDVKPWIDVNQNYHTINVENDLMDKDSILHFYQKLIRLRKEIKCIYEGKYELINPTDHQFFHYTRSTEDELIHVIANFTDQYLSSNDEVEGRMILSNYAENEKLYKPYEVRVYYQNKVGDHDAQLS
ncbi:glucohydrolase [Tenericutes bacterium MZ-XQ]|nr:glucohydrolase [Tenericutes bacterium MZ-XQ]